MGRSALRRKPGSEQHETEAQEQGGKPSVSKRTDQKPSVRNPASRKKAPVVKTAEPAQPSGKAGGSEKSEPKTAASKAQRGAVQRTPSAAPPQPKPKRPRSKRLSDAGRSSPPSAETQRDAQRPDGTRLETGAAKTAEARKPKAAKAGAKKAEAKKAEDRKPEEPKSSAGADQRETPFVSPEVEAFALNMTRLWEHGGKAAAAYMKPRDHGLQQPPAEIADIARTLGQVVERWTSDPRRVVEAQRDFSGGFLELWTNTLKRLSGEQTEPTVRPDPRDARFKDPEWSEHPVFDFIKQAYLLTSRWAESVVANTDGLDPHVRHKASFYVKLLSNAASPSNFLPTNPELIRETIASKGENLVRGMQMLAEDIDAGNGGLRIRQTDRSGFEVGRNLATTPGKVVFRNPLFELIQYAPTTEMVRARPLLIVPPWINKFYVLDLTPEKSLIRWAVEQGLTVFCISWVNPDSRHAAMSFDDYMLDGILTATDVAREICGTESIDAAGYCVGGTLLSVTLAWLAAKGDTRIASGTLMTTQVDFTHAGDLKVFVDEEQIAAVEARMAEAGYLEGASMANAFNMIRSNDMIFPYIVNNYMRGKAPFPFDLLYWNSDATRMPAANHSFYLRSCYLNNDLARGRMEIMGEILDLQKVEVPVYHIAAREDHIAPAQSVFLGAQLFGGPVRFVLAGSGHIVGVVNPPAKMKYQHWVGREPKGELQHWLDHAEEKPGSWWPDWRAWLAALDATMVDARVPGSGPYEALGEAPGEYVKVKA